MICGFGDSQNWGVAWQKKSTFFSLELTFFKLDDGGDDIKKEKKEHEVILVVVVGDVWMI